MKRLNGKIGNRSRERGLDRGDVDSSGNYSNSRRGINRVKAGALGAGLCLLVGCASGCGTIYRHDPVTRAIVDAHPSFLVPYGVKKEREKMEREERAHQENKTKGDIKIKTKDGYELTLGQNSNIFYKGKKHVIYSIEYPYVSLVPSEGFPLFNSRKEFRITIQELIKGI